jgi:chromosome segregation ATPase
MAIAEELVVQIRAEVDRAVREIKKVDKQLDKTAKSSKTMGKSFSTSFKTLAGGLAIGAAIAGLQALRRAVSESVDAFQRQEQAVARLDGVLRATGEAAGFNSDELQRMASRLQGVTTFGDEAIIEMQSLLLTFKSIQGEGFERTTELALDMSAAFGQDMKSSALQLGKALEDPATGLTALRRVGVSFTEEQKNLIKSLQDAGDVAGAQGVILDVLEGQVGGVSQAMADTASGVAVRYKNALGDIKEQFGQMITEGLRPAREELLEVIEKFREFDDYLAARQDLSDAAEEAFFARDIAAMEESIDDFEARIGETTQNLARLRQEANDVGPVRRIGINNNIIRLEEELRSLEVERNNLQSTMNNLTQLQIEAGQRIAEQRRQALAEAEREREEAERIAREERQRAEELESQTRLATDMRERLREIAGEIERQITGETEIERLERERAELIAEANKNYVKSGDEIDRINELYDTLIAKTIEEQKQQKILSDALEYSGISAEDAAEMMEQMPVPIMRAKEEVEDLRNAFERLVDTVNAGASGEWAAAYDEISKNAQSVIDVHEGLNEYLGGTFSSTLSAISDLQQNRFNAEIAQLTQIRDRYEKNSQAYREAQEDINEAKKEQFRKEKAAAISMALVNGALAVTKALAELGPIAGGIAAGVIAAATAVQVGTIASQQVPLAQGGIVTGPTNALIGEAGPEAVIPLDRMGGMGGTTVVNAPQITVQGSMIHERELIRYITGGQRRMSRGY